MRKKKLQMNKVKREKITERLKETKIRRMGKIKRGKEMIQKNLSGTNTSM